MALILNSTLLDVSDEVPKNVDLHEEDTTMAAAADPYVTAVANMTTREVLEMGVQDMLDRWRYQVRWQEKLAYLAVVK